MFPWLITQMNFAVVMDGYISTVKINFFIITLCLQVLQFYFLSSMKKKLFCGIICLVGFIGSLISLNHTYVQSQVEQVGENKLGSYRAFLSLLFQLVFIFSYQHRFTVTSMSCKSGTNSLKQQLGARWRCQRNIEGIPMVSTLGLRRFFATSLGGQHPSWIQLLTLHFLTVDLRN